MGDFDLEKWWNKKDKENKVWFLYKALAILAITIGFIAGDEPIRYVAMCATALLGLHLVIWPFFTETTSASTKIVVTSFLVFCIIAGFVPNFTHSTMTGIKKAVADFDSGQGQEEKVAQRQTTSLKKAPSGTLHGKEPSPQILNLVPNRKFAGVITPYGKWTMSADCPAGCISQVDHDGDIMCSANGGAEVDTDGKRWLSGTYQWTLNGREQTTKCLFTVLPNGDRVVPRFRERFLVLPGIKPQYTNLEEATFSWGASWGIDPNDPGLGQVVALVKIRANN